MLTRFAAAAVVTVLGLAVTNTADAQSLRHIDYLASQLEGQVRDLEYEFGRTYRHAVQYRHLMSDTRQMAGLASHIHQVVHRPHHGFVHHLQSDLRSLDRLFHHVERLVRDIDHAAHHGHGHLHGSSWRVRSKLASVSRTLHHLKNDISRLVHRVEPHHHHHNHGFPVIRFRIR